MSSATLTIAGEDVSLSTAYDVTVDVGRADIESQPDASVLNANLIGYEPAGDVGDPVRLTSSEGLIFHGWISDLRSTLSADDAGELVWETDVTATGPLALLGQVQTGADGYPEQSDSERIWQILTDAGIGHTVNPNVVGPPIIPHPAELAGAADMARSVADSGTGVLWEQPADPVTPLRYSAQRARRWAIVYHTWDELHDEIMWADAGPWRWFQINSENIGGTEGAPPHIILDPATVIADATFEQTIGDLARAVTVVYGPEGGGDRPNVTVGTQPPHITIDTELANAGDATAKADTVYRQRRDPAWRVSGLTLNLLTLTPDIRSTIVKGLEVGAKLEVPFPLGSPVGVLWQGFLEGWQHQLLPDAHWLELRASERSLTEPCLRWIDSVGYLWLEVAAYEIWESACDLITTIIALRWGIVSANDRWERVPPGETWASALDGWEAI
jgi:hypothetical protein